MTLLLPVLVAFVVVLVLVLVLTGHGSAFVHWWRVRPWLLLLVLIAGVTQIGVIRLDREASSRCQDNRDNRAVIRELVEVATTPSSGGSADLTRLTELPEFAALSPEDQAYWHAFLAAVSPRTSQRPPASDDAKGDDPQGDTSTERLIKFAQERLTPISCK